MNYNSLYLSVGFEAFSGNFRWNSRKMKLQWRLQNDKFLLFDIHQPKFGVEKGKGIKQKYQK